MLLRKSIFFLFFTFSFFASYAQDIENKIEMGTIKAGDDRIADFEWLNDKSETVYILRTDVPDNCDVRFSAKELKPGETGIIRVKYNPERKGPFSQKIPIYFSSLSTPITLQISGFVQYIEPNMDRICPNFQMAEDDKLIKQGFSVQVIDKTSGLPIPGASVKYKPNPTFWPTAITGKEGLTHSTLPIGLYQISAEAKGYDKEIQEMYVGKDITSTVFILNRNENYKEPSEPVFTSDDSASLAKNPTNPIRFPNINFPTSKSSTEEKPGELPLSTFAPNNIVFLIDVSSSMGYPDRLPLLKKSMINLLSNLRSVDKVSIVIYAGGTEVLMQSVSGDNKQKIARKINGLKASGSTAGGKGIREAYRIAKNNFISNGNNQIILATDGDFNLDKTDEALFEYIEENTKSGIMLSVIGFGKKEKAIEKMKNIAQTGKGSYMHVSTEEDSNTVLIEEVKQRSRKL